MKARVLFETKSACAFCKKISKTLKRRKIFSLSPICQICSIYIIIHKTHAAARRVKTKKREKCHPSRARAAITPRAQILTNTARPLRMGPGDVARAKNARHLPTGSPGIVRPFATPRATCRTPIRLRTPPRSSSTRTRTGTELKTKVSKKGLFQITGANRPRSRRRRPRRAL
jgi:hypothetical protein